MWVKVIRDDVAYYIDSSVVKNINVNGPIQLLGMSHYAVDLEDQTFIKRKGNISEILDRSLSIVNESL